MTKKATKLLKTLRAVADNPDITVGSAKKLTKTKTTIQKYKEYLHNLEEQGLLATSLALNNLPVYHITDKGKSFIENIMPSGKTIQDSPGVCTKCNNYSTQLSGLKDDLFAPLRRYCPNCMNHDDYREPPYKSFSSIDLCRDY